MTAGPSLLRFAAIWRREVVAAACVLGTAVATIVLIAPRALSVVLLDGAYPFLVLAAALGYGGAILPRATIAPAGSVRRGLLCVALGLGVIGLMTLMLGVSSGLNQRSAWAMVAIGIASALVRAVRSAAPVSVRTVGAAERSSSVERPPLPYGHGADPRPPSRSGEAGSSAPGEPLRSSGTAGVLLSPLGVLAGVMLVAASLPPGLIWKDEANGYDALEYHLQGPREYFEAGRITFLPHNVYTSFPQQTEILYLLLMHLCGGAYAGAIPSQLLHTMLGILAVAAVGAWSPARDRMAAMLLVGGVPWVAYLGGLAYVELAMLFFTAVGAGLLLSGNGVDHRRYWFVGLCGGLAAGCKYTAIVLVAAPLAVGALWGAGSIGRRVKRSLIVALASLLGFSPWLVRNIAFTGNPLYPFAYDVFGGAAWSDEQAKQWATGHRPKPPDDALPARLLRAGRETWGSSLFGVATIWASGALLLVRRVVLRNRPSNAEAWLILGLAAWIFLTEGAGRFAVPLIIPLAWGVVGTLGDLAPRRGLTWTSRVAMATTVLLSAAGAVNARALWLLLLEHERRIQSRTESDVRFNDMAGQTESLRLQMHALNQLPAAGTRIHLIGDAAVFYVDRPLRYTVVFNRDPLVELARGGASAAECVTWLRTQGVSHLVFSWPEIERLRRTYGFPEVVTPAWSATLQAAGLRRSELSTNQLEILVVPAAAS